MKKQEILKNLKEGKSLTAFQDNYYYTLSENDTPEPEEFKLSISVEQMPPHKTKYFDDITEIEELIKGLNFEIDGEY